MTRDEWETCSAPLAMLTWLREQGKVSDHKARLFAAAVCRRIWPLLPGEEFRQSLNLLEQFADAKIDLTTFDTGTAAVWDIVLGQRRQTFTEPVRCAGRAVFHAIRRYDGGGYHPDFARFASDQVVAAVVAQGESERDESVVHAHLLRDLVNPFYVGHFDPALRTPAVVALATTIYESRDFDRMSKLAALLEAAGATDASLLQHLRGDGPFVRGDWVVDFTLQKE